MNISRYFKTNYFDLKALIKSIKNLYNSNYYLNKSRNK